MRATTLLLALQFASVSLAQKVFGVEYGDVQICQNRISTRAIVCSATRNRPALLEDYSGDIEQSFDFWYTAKLMYDLGLSITEGCRCVSLDPQANNRLYVYDQSPRYGKRLDILQFNAICISQPDRSIYTCDFRGKQPHTLPLPTLDMSPFKKCRRLETQF